MPTTAPSTVNITLIASLFFIVFYSEICLVTHGLIREYYVNDTAKIGAENTM